MVTRIRICLFLVGFGILHAGYITWSSWTLPPSWIKKPVFVTGEIVSIPKTKPYGQQFIFHVRSIQHSKADTRVKLYWVDPPPALLAGSRWQFMVKLKPAHGLSNPGGFNFGRYLWVNGIRATGGVVRRLPYRHLGSSDVWDPLRWRGRLWDFIRMDFRDSCLMGILAALSLGEKSGLSASDWRVLQHTGTSHLVAISGLHVGLVSLLIYGFFSLLWRLVPGAVFRCPAPKVGAIAALVGAIFYALLAGLSLPTQRALIMLLCLFVNKLSTREIPLGWRLLYAFFWIIALEPFAILSISFWMSFTAVAWILYLAAQHREDGSIKKLLRLQIGITLGLVPISLYCFQGVSLLSIPANLIAIPVVSWWVVPFCLLGSVFFFFSAPITAHYCFQVAEWVLHYLWSYLGSLARVPWAMVWYSMNSLWAVVFSMLGVGLLLSALTFRWRISGVLFLLPVFLWPGERPKLNQLWVSVLDVGQGLSVLLETANHTLIYDAGPKSFGGFDAGASIVIPYLRYRHIPRVDMLMISHKDMDHRGGAYSLLKTFPVGRLVTSAPHYFRHWTVTRCHVGQRWDWDGVHFAVLSPVSARATSSNDRSCVLHARVGQQSILLTGDIEKSVEQQLLSHDPKALRATLLIAPHHGSKTSSSLGFLQAVHPRQVVFSAGFYNRYHLPSPSVVRRYHALGIVIFNTAKQGALFFRLTHGAVSSPILSTN